MQPRDAFGVVVRSLGLVSFLYGSQALLTWLSFATSFSSTLEHGVRMHAVIYLALGILLIRAADVIVRFAYPARDG